MATLLIKRGLAAGLPTLEYGELAWVDDDKELHIGTASAGNTLIAGGTSFLKLDASNDPITAGLMIDGSSDEVQLTVQANATQTANILEIENSGGTALAGFDGGGDLFIGGTLANAQLYIYKLLGSDIGADLFNISTNTTSIQTQTGEIFGVKSSVTAAGTSKDYPAVKGLQFQAILGSTGTVTAAYGGLFYVTANSTGTYTNSYGVQALFQSTAAGTFTLAEIFTASLSVSAGTITDIIHYKVPAGTTGATITNRYGLQMDNISGATNNWAIQTNAGLVTFNEGADSNSDFRVESGNDTHLIFADAGNDAVGINASSITGKFHVDQSDAAGAKPVITIDQADVSEEFLRFIGSAAAGVLTQSVVDNGDVTTATLQGWVKVYVQDDGNQITDQAYYVPLYTLV